MYASPGEDTLNDDEAGTDGEAGDRLGLVLAGDRGEVLDGAEEAAGAEGTAGRDAIPGR